MSTVKIGDNFLYQLLTTPPFPYEFFLIFILNQETHEIPRQYQG